MYGPLKEKIQKENRANPVSVILGSDGAGKTTVSDIVSNITGYPIINTPPEILNQSRPYIKQNAGPILDLLFNTAGVLIASQDIKRAKQNNQGLLCVRYLVDSAVYHVLRPDTNLSLDEVFPAELSDRLSLELEHPDIFVYLHAHPKSLIQRMEERGLKEENYADNWAEESAKKAVENYSDLDKLFFQGLELPLFRGDSLFMEIDASPIADSKVESISMVVRELLKTISDKDYENKDIEHYVIDYLEKNVNKK